MSLAFPANVLPRDAGAAEQSAPPALPRRSRPVRRRLPVTRTWPTAVTVLVQVGILVGFVVLWEVGAEFKWVDAFFWSRPSAIWSTALIFFTEGNAFVDIGFTFRSTIIGFVIGTIAGAFLGLSMWWSRNYASIVQPYIICWSRSRNWRSRRSSSWCSGWGWPPRSRLRRR